MILNHLKMQSMIKLLQLYLSILQIHVEQFSVKVRNHSVRSFYGWRAEFRTDLSREHMEKLVDLCDRYRLPIIADEIYAGMVFPGREFTSFAAVSNRVPMIVCGGLAKRFLVPGWRLG